MKLRGERLGLYTWQVAHVVAIYIYVGEEDGRGQVYLLVQF